VPVYKTNPSRPLILLPATTIGAAVPVGLSPVILGMAAMKSLIVQATFVYGAGGTTCKAWVQTSFDKGGSWVDIINFAFLLASAKKISAVKQSTVVAGAYVGTDGTLADDTIKDGLLGDRLRVRYTTTGTYTGLTTLALSAVSKD
jgi:hypothetical protein